eukprot:1154307-Pelagomonas_calceolata.AAC.2
MPPNALHVSFLAACVPQAATAPVRKCTPRLSSSYHFSILLHSPLPAGHTQQAAGTPASAAQA